MGVAMSAVPSLPFNVTGPIGLDMDGTITGYPEYFSALARSVRVTGNLVHVVSSRSPTGEAETRKELKELGLAYDYLYLLPDFGKKITRCPHRELAWYDQYLWQKLEYCAAHEIRVFYDDDPRVLSLFARYASHDIQTNPEWPAARDAQQADPADAGLVASLLNRLS